MRALVLGLLLITAAHAQAQFQILPSPTTADLRGIHAVSPEIAWASGTNGTVLRTTDAGAHWTLCPTPPNAEHLDLRGIQAFDSQTAIVMSSGKGPLSRLYKTTDACAHWTLVFTNPDPEGSWAAIQFADSKIGWLMGNPTRGQFQLWEANDGGTNWIREAKSQALSANSESSGAFAASNSALTLGFPRTTFPRFASGGPSGAFVYQIEETTLCMDCDQAPKDHWRRDKVPILSGTGSSGVFSLGAVNSSLLVAVGGDYETPEASAMTAAFSSDAGRIWHPAQTPPHGFRSAIAYSPDHKTWITVGPNGTDISTDDGRNWRPLRPDATAGDPPDADRNWNALSLPYVVGTHGRIGKLRPQALTQR